MASDRNPTNSAIMQVLLDLEEAGYKTQVGSIIASLQANKKLLGDLETRFQQRGYNQDKVAYTQLTIDQHLMLLSDTAFKVLTMLGMFCAQDGMIGVKIEVIQKTCGLSRSTVQRAIKELMSYGLLAEIDGKKRHEPAIWQVHPGIIHSGKRQFIRAQEAEYLKRLKISQEGYILNQDLPLVIQQDSVYRKLPDGNKLYFMRVDLMASQTEKEPSDNPTLSKSSHKSTTVNDSSNEISGQMVITDFIPDPTQDLDDIPF